MPANYPVLRILSLGLLCFSAAGCRGVSHQQGMLERESTNAQLSSHQLRVMVNEFVTHFADRIELRGRDSRQCRRPGDSKKCPAMEDQWNLCLL